MLDDPTSERPSQRESASRLPDPGVAEEGLSLAIVHHANQYVITNGYLNRCGLSDVVGPPDGSSGYLRILALHEKYQVPLNLHVSGTLLEALAWYRPDCIEVLRRLVDRGLIDLVGSSYGQNIMRFFSPAHNLRQLNEALALYRDLLGVDPRRVKVFWPPERVWDTQSLAPVLTHPSLINGGYRQVLVDDRLLYPPGTAPGCRKAYDSSRRHRAEDFLPCSIRGGSGLTALPISMEMRYWVPLLSEESGVAMGDLLDWLAASSREKRKHLICIYGDDLEKAAGIGDWNPRGPEGFEAFLSWLRGRGDLSAVKLTDWSAGGRDFQARPPLQEKAIEVGTFIEMCNHFGAGEGYEKWYYDPRWDPYRDYTAKAEKRVMESASRGSDPALICLAHKQVMASTWETAWHTPSSGVHGDPRHWGEPSPWIKAVASHARHALVIAEAADWTSDAGREDEAQAYLVDIDGDGEKELVLKNGQLFAVFAPSWGGRLVYLFQVGGPEGKLVIGNPCDDWHWMEELNKYMEIPANHPGAFADQGFEHVKYHVRVSASRGPSARVQLWNLEASSKAFGLEKSVSLAAGSNEVEVHYRLPAGLEHLTIECGFSPDYLSLLREGRRLLEESVDGETWRTSCGGTSAWLRLPSRDGKSLQDAQVREFGHGKSIRFAAPDRQFTAFVGSSQASTEPPSEEGPLKS